MSDKKNLKEKVKGHIREYNTLGEEIDIPDEIEVEYDDSERTPVERDDESSDVSHVHMKGKKEQTEAGNLVLKGEEPPKRKRIDTVLKDNVPIGKTKKKLSPLQERLNKIKSDAKEIAADSDILNKHNINNEE